MIKTVSSKLILTVVYRINQRDEILEAPRQIRKRLAMIQAGNDKKLMRIVVAMERRTGTRDLLGRGTF